MNRPKVHFSRVPEQKGGFVHRSQGPGFSATSRPAAHRNIPGCRTSSYMPPGSDKVGLSTSNQPCKEVWELDYGLDEQQYKKLSARFPGHAFVQVGTDCHDHPIAHTSYRVVWKNVLAKLTPGSLVADIAGNPAHNVAFNKGQTGRRNPIQIDTYCQVLCPRDAVRRKTRWGPMMDNGVVRWEEMTLYDMIRTPENRERFSHYDTFLMNQVLYYYTFAEITELLNLADAVLIATIHKLPGQSGTINCGEQAYVKDFVTGKVTQTNVETGEEYKHNDPAPWFQRFSYADERGAIAWTVNKGCEDTYKITITTCDPKLVPEENWLGGRVIFKSAGESIVITSPEAVEPPPAYAQEEVELKTSDFLPGYGEEKIQTVRITHPKVYEGLKHFMINKPRNMKTLQDLTAKAHRDVGNNPLYGSKGKVDVSSDDLTRMIACAWRHGAKLDDDMIRFVTATDGSSITSLNATLAGKSTAIHPHNVIKQVARFAILLEGVRSAKTPHVEALQVIQDLF